MKTFNTSFIDETSLGEFVRSRKIFDSEQCLIQVFCGKADDNYIKSIVSAITNVLPLAKLIGATSSGGILPEGLESDRAVISISVFEATSIKTHFEQIDNNSLEAGQKIARSLSGDNVQLAILFCDGLQSDGELILDGVNQVLPGTTIVGGRAGDSGHLDVTFVFDKQNISQTAVVGASLSSKKLRVIRDYSLSWQPIGKEMTVTKSEGNRTYEVDSYTVKELYERYLGKKIADDMPYSCGEFPLLKISTNGTTIARGVTQVFEDGSAVLGGSLNEGDKVRLGFGNVNIVLSERDRAFRRLADLNLESLFVYSCTARLSYLQPEAAFEEIKPLRNIAPLAGFFTYGEFYHDRNKTELMNLTMTFVGLSERDEPTDPIPLPDHSAESISMFSGKHYNILNALTTLVNRVTGELYETNKALEKQASEDYLTGLANRRTFFERGEFLLQFAKRNKTPLTFCYLDFDDFKSINDIHGHSIGDAILKAVTVTIQEKIRKSDLFARLGGEEFALLLSNTNLNGAATLCESVRAAVANTTYNFGNVSLKVTISCGIAKVDLDSSSLDAACQNADIALYDAKSHGKNCVRLSKE